MNILVTGANGFVGRHLIQRLLSDDVNVFAVVRRATDCSSLDMLRVDRFVLEDDIDELTGYIRAKNIDGVIHLASLFVVDHKASDIPDLINSNVTLGARVLEASCCAGVRWFINTGTFWQHYLGENYNPVNLYAATKQAFEVIAKYYVETFGIRFVTLKLSDTYGPNDTRRKIVKLWQDSLETGSVLDMSGGEQLIDIVHVSDVVSAFHQLVYLLSHDDPRVAKGDSYYVTSGTMITLRELAGRFEQKKGKKLNINWGARPYRDREVMIPQCVGDLVPGWALRHTEVFDEI